MSETATESAAEVDLSRLTLARIAERLETEGDRLDEREQARLERMLATGKRIRKRRAGYSRIGGDGTVRRVVA